MLRLRPLSWARADVSFMRAKHLKIPQRALWMRLPSAAHHVNGRFDTRSAGAHTGLERGVVDFTVLGDDQAPVEPVEQFLVYLASIERSPNTVKPTPTI